MVPMAFRGPRAFRSAAQRRCTVRAAKPGGTPAVSPRRAGARGPNGVRDGMHRPCDMHASLLTTAIQLADRAHRHRVSVHLHRRDRMREPTPQWRVPSIGSAIHTRRDTRLCRVSCWAGPHASQRTPPRHLSGGGCLPLWREGPHGTPPPRSPGRRGRVCPSLQVALAYPASAGLRTERPSRGRAH